MIIKVAILLLYLRLTPSTKFRNCVYVAIAFIIATSFSMGMVTSFPCRHPISASWDYSARFATTKCVNYAKVLKTQGFFHLIGDLVILFLPFPVMWKSSMARMQKTHVMILLSLGGWLVISAAPEYRVSLTCALASQSSAPGVCIASSRSIDRSISSIISGPSPSSLPSLPPNSISESSAPASPQRD